MSYRDKFRMLALRDAVITDLVQKQSLRNVRVKDVN